LAIKAMGFYKARRDKRNPDAKALRSGLGHPPGIDHHAVSGGRPKDHEGQKNKGRVAAAPRRRPREPLSHRSSLHLVRRRQRKRAWVVPDGRAVLRR